MTAAKNAPCLTAERLGELLHYNPETGHFTRLSTFGSNRLVGGRAGSITTKGYREIMIDGRSYREHRLAWLYVHGVWPEAQIDHRDGVRDHNAINNLRPATNAQNAKNRAKHKNNASGFKGASFHKGTCRWQAQIMEGNQKIYLGLYDTAEEAHAAYVAAALRLHGTFARTAR